MTTLRRSPTHRVRGKEAPQSRRLTLQGHMVPTPGERDDSCGRYSDCLGAHVRAYLSAPAMCPRGCAWYIAAAKLDPNDYKDSGLGKMDVM